MLGESKALAQNDIIFLDSNFTKIDLQKIAKTFETNENKDLHEFFKSTLNASLNGDRPIYYNGRDSNMFLGFTIKNTSYSTLDLVLELSSSLIYEINFYEVKDGEFNWVNTTGSKYPLSTKIKESRGFVYPIKLLPNEEKSIFLRFKTSHTSLVVPGSLCIKDVYDKSSLFEYMFIGVYFGLSLFIILLSLFVYTFIRNNVFLIYAIYLIFLTVNISLFLGVFFQFFNTHFFGHNLQFFVISSQLTIISFVIFTQELLKVKNNFPILYKTINYILAFSVLLRFQFFIVPTFYFTYKPLILQLWYFSLILMIIGFIVEIFLSFKYQRKTTAFFSMGFFFILIGMFITILHHQKGLVNSYFFGLPILLYASVLEIILMTISLAYLFKEVYLERNLLSEKVIKQQKQIISSFLDGEEKERKRISIELHDNIGSKLSHLSHRLTDNPVSEEIKENLYEIFKDVRNLSHQITPADFRMVGLKGAISDLANSIAEVTAINIEFHTYDFKDNPGTKICLNLYRITQEALNNIVKHAKATHVDIQLIELDTHINLSIEDNGIGFDVLKPWNGIGLQNIRTRAEQLNANISIDSNPGRGTTLLISVPKE